MNSSFELNRLDEVDQKNFCVRDLMDDIER